MLCSKNRSESPDKYYFINKYNNRCAARNSLKSKGKFASSSTRPLTADGRFYHCSVTNVEGCGEDFSKISSSQELNDQSRSSTPDFMQEVYDAYSNLDIDNENLLLRRPISRSGCNSEENCCNLELEVQSKRRNSSPASIGLAVLSTSELVKPSPNLPDEKKTVKVAIDIPSCEKNFTNKEAENDTLLEDSNSSKVNDIDESLQCDNDDTQSVQSFKSSDSSKSRSISKKVRTKKKSRVKKKAASSTISLDNSRANQTSKRARPPPQPVWRSSDDDIVTQMSTLKLTKESDNEFTSTSSGEPVAPVAASASFNPRRSNTKISSPANFIFSPKNASSSSRARRIPIQIISDPFMGSGDNDVKQKVKKRPHSGIFCNSRHHGSTQCWK